MNQIVFHLKFRKKTNLTTELKSDYFIKIPFTFYSILPSNLCIVRLWINCQRFYFKCKIILFLSYPHETHSINRLHKQNSRTIQIHWMNSCFDENTQWENYVCMFHWFQLYKVQHTKPKELIRASRIKFKFKVKWACNYRSHISYLLHCYTLNFC